MYAIKDSDKDENKYAMCSYLQILKSIGSSFLSLALFLAASEIQSLTKGGQKWQNIKGGQEFIIGK